MGGIIKGKGFTFARRTIAAGTASDTATAADGLIQCSTDGAQVLTATVPEAANNLGLILTYQFKTDGGVNVNVVRTGSDTFDESGDTGNTQFAMANAGEAICLMAVDDDIWMVISRIDGILT